MSDDDLMVFGGLALAGLLIWNSPTPLPVTQTAQPSTQPEGSPGSSVGPGSVGVAFQGDGFMVQGEIPIGAPGAGGFLGGILGGNIDDMAAGAMNPVSNPRLMQKSRSGAMTVTAPDDPAGEAALRQLDTARGGQVAPIQPNPAAATSSIRKIGTTGLSVVPPAPADRTSALSPEIRRWAALRSVG